MKKVIIPQKMSGTGSIHDIASQYSDREIKFPKGAQYAVVLASYYGGKGYTTHATESATAQSSKRQSEWSHQIIGVDGYIYDIKPSYYDNELERVSCDPYEVQDFEEATQAAAVLGKSKSNKKSKASRANGHKGGRPRKVSI